MLSKHCFLGLYFVQQDLCSQSQNGQNEYEVITLALVQFSCYRLNDSIRIFCLITCQNGTLNVLKYNKVINVWI